MMRNTFSLQTVPVQVYHVRMRFAFLRGSVLCTVFLAACASGTVQQPPSGWSAYEHADMGVRMFHPSDWTYAEGGAGEERAVIFSAPEGGDLGNASLAVQPLPEAAMDLDAYTAYYVDAMQPALQEQGLSVEILTSERATMAGQPAHQLIFTMAGGDSTKAIMLWTLRSGRVYTFNYAAPEAAFDASAPVMRGMLESIVLR